MLVMDTLKYQSFPCQKFSEHAFSHSHTIYKVIRILSFYSSKDQTNCNHITQSDFSITLFKQQENGIRKL